MRIDKVAATGGDASRDISYAFSAKTGAARALIKTIENISGRHRLLRLARGYQDEVLAGRDFWEVMQSAMASGWSFRWAGWRTSPAQARWS